MLEEHVDWITEEEQRELFFRVVYTNRWQFGQVSDNKIEPNYPQWFQGFYNLKERDYHDSAPDIVRTLGDRFMSQFCDDSYTMVRNMASANTFGLDGDIHTDWPHPGESITGVLYTDKTWELNWGGETVFYFDEFARASVYIPRKIVVFDGSIPHIGKGPQRRCREMRNIMAFQAVKTDVLEKKLAK